jgi:hypothetical protein
MKQLLTILFLGLAALTASAQTSSPEPVDGTDCSNLFFKALLDEDANAVGSLVFK